MQQPRLRARVHVDLERVVVGPGDVQPSRDAQAAAGAVGAAGLGCSRAAGAARAGRAATIAAAARRDAPPTPEGGESGDIRSIQSSVTMDTQYPVRSTGAAALGACRLRRRRPGDHAPEPCRRGAAPPRVASAGPAPERWAPRPRWRLGQHGDRHRTTSAATNQA